MKKVYFVRHQRAGVMHKHAFASYPTEAQVSAVSAHGEAQAPTPAGKDPAWVQVVEVDLYGDEVPEAPKPPRDTISVSASLGLNLDMSGTGTVG